MEACRGVRRWTQKEMHFHKQRKLNKKNKTLQAMLIPEIIANNLSSQ